MSPTSYVVPFIIYLFIFFVAKLKRFVFRTISFWEFIYTLSTGSFGFKTNVKPRSTIKQTDYLSDWI